MKIAYWLIPAPGYRPELEKIISDFAVRFDAPIFEPHVTIYSGSAVDENEPRNLLDNLRFAPKPLCLEAQSVGVSEEFTKSLFLQFKPSEDLARLSAMIKAASSEMADYVLNPHLSLLYAPISLAEKQRAAASLNLPITSRRYREFWFSEVKVVSIPRVQTKQDVEGWKTIYATDFS